MKQPINMDTAVLAKLNSEDTLTFEYENASPVSMTESDRKHTRHDIYKALAYNLDDLGLWLAAPDSPFYISYAIKEDLLIPLRLHCKAIPKLVNDDIMNTAAFGGHLTAFVDEDGHAYTIDEALLYHQVAINQMFYYPSSNKLDTKLYQCREVMHYFEVGGFMLLQGHYTGYEVELLKYRLAVDPIHYKGFIGDLQWIDCQLARPDIGKDIYTKDAALIAHMNSYLDRFGKKDSPVQELMKARWYLNKRIEIWQEEERKKYAI